MPQYSGIWTLGQAAQAIKNQDWAGVPPTVVEYLVVAGGGSGGFTYGAGGGAGGLLQGFAGVAPGTSYFVTVGAGGASNVGVTDGNNGFASVFDATSSNASTGRIIATGGGGAGGSSSTATAGKSGGSGGGAGGYGGLPGGAGTSGQGNAGGAGQGTNANYGSGGGGGAGTVGFAGTTTSGGNGGAGIASDITGTRAVYAGGGGGGIYDSGTGGIGGVGGGGSVNPTSNTNGNPGQPNTGGGGSGNKMNGSVGGLTGGAGGSGIVVIRYPGNVQYFTGGTLNYSNGHIVHTFYSSGTLAPTAPRLFASPDYQISRSIRFNNPDGPLLERAGSAGGNRQTWTWSGWIKRSKLNTNGNNVPFLFGASDRATGSAYLQFGTSGSDSAIDCLSFQEQSGGSYIIVTQAKFRDTSAWYHVVCAYDTTQAIPSDRVKIYVNGILQAIVSSGNYPPQNSNGYVNYSAFPYLIGAYATSYLPTTFDGYMAEVNFVDGQQLTPASFGYTEFSTGVWSPLQYTGSYGTRGFYLNFADNSNTTAATLGKDLSGNGNNFTPYNFSVSAGVGNDSLVESPTNYGVDTGAGGEVRGNYCTWNPLRNDQNAVLSNGNLDLSTVNVTARYGTYTTIGASSAKWYWEITAGSLSTDGYNIGIASASKSATSALGSDTESYIYLVAGTKRTNNVTLSYGASYTAGDVIGVALDLDAGTLVFYKNGTSQGTAYTSIPSNTWFPVVADDATGSTVGSSFIANFGQRPFAYTAPTGYKALCTQNLPESGAGKLPGKYFGVATYTGTGVTRPVYVGFQPDFVWVKTRNTTYSHALYDSVRGTGKFLRSNTIDADISYNPASQDLMAFNYDSFLLGTNFHDVINTNGNSYVAWNWAAGGTTVTNTTGSISAQVRANPAAGFSIVTYTGTGANATVGHGLGVAPSMIIQKNRTGYNWRVYHVSAGNTKELYLDLTTEATTASTWNNTTPTSSVFSIGGGSGINGGGFACVAYCFAEVPGYSRFGSYIGNGSTDGPFVYTGFRPAFILTKDITTGSFWWEMVDSARSSFNPSNKTLYANVADAEYTSSGYDKDLLSNGFKIRGTNGGQNTSGSTYIYMAFAESPFKYARAR
jgi:hypothetical protein